MARFNLRVVSCSVLSKWEFVIDTTLVLNVPAVGFLDSLKASKAGLEHFPDILKPNDTSHELIRQRGDIEGWDYCPERSASRLASSIRESSAAN